MLVGVLIGEGHFGGDGRQPHITLRMHVRHAPLFNWIQETFPGGKLYGPYNHDGREYLQWMARGSFLRDVLVPLLDERLSPQLDAKSAERYAEMKLRYQRRLQSPQPALNEEALISAVVEDSLPSALDNGPQPLPKTVSSEGARGTSSATEVFERLREQLE